MNTFTKEISFINPAFFDAETTSHIEKEVIKLATFKELSRTDKSQRDFQFLMMSVFESKKEGSLQINYKVLSDIAENAIESLLILDDEFTAIDKSLFLNDNGAVINFAYWLLGEKLTPFFSQLIPKL